MSDYEVQLNEAEKKIIELQKWKNKTILESFQIAENFNKVKKELEKTKIELKITQDLYVKDSKDLREIIESYRTINYN